ncbi:MAG: hypothetical protein ACXAEN_27155 [Candidatus Thorarchaeota archaeon]|jgi:enolase
MVKITEVRAIEILDSRGNPTIRTRVKLSDGTIGVAKVPSGASTGIHEAVELRDGGKRYGGKGVQNAVSNVNKQLAEVVASVDPLSHADIDRALLDADPSKGKGTLGANAILSVSMATAVAAAKHLVSADTRNRKRRQVSTSRSNVKCDQRRGSCRERFGNSRVHDSACGRS